MEIAKGIEIIETALWLKKQNILIINDLHIGYGEVLQRKGILVPKFQLKEIITKLEHILEKTKPEKVIIIKGNHDPIIAPIAEKRRVAVVTEYSVDDTLIVHGDELMETKATRIIIGHEHPAITMREGSKWEKYKCFLKGKWQRKELIAVPSFNPLLEGTDILKEEVLSPFLEDIATFKVYIV